MEISTTASGAKTKSKVTGCKNLQRATPIKATGRTTRCMVKVKFCIQMAVGMKASSLKVKRFTAKGFTTTKTEIWADGQTIL